VPYAGHALQVRFSYVLDGLGYYDGIGNGSSLVIGWHFDDISFTDTEELTAPVVQDVAATQFTFTPTQIGSYALDARAQVYGAFLLEWGPIQRVDAIDAPPPSVQFTGQPTVSTGQVRIDFTVTNYRSGLTFGLLKTMALPGGWAADTNATFETVVPDSAFRVTAPTGAAAQAFYRLLVN